MASVTVPALHYNSSLIGISEHLEALIDSLDLCEDPDVRAECEQELLDTLARLLVKVDSCAEYQDHLASSIALRKQQVILLEKANRRAQSILDRIDNAVLRVLDSTGRKSLEGSLYSYTLRRLPPSVEVSDMALVPPQYIRTTISEVVDKVAAKVDLRKGHDIPGLRYVLDRMGVSRR